jgi:hypothetical protein
MYLHDPGFSAHKKGDVHDDIGENRQWFSWRPRKIRRLNIGLYKLDFDLTMHICSIHSDSLRQ